jgi:hypothetical protein
MVGWSDQGGDIGGARSCQQLSLYGIDQICSLLHSAKVSDTRAGIDCCVLMIQSSYYQSLPQDPVVDPCRIICSFRGGT